MVLVRVDNLDRKAANCCHIFVTRRVSEGRCCPASLTRRVLLRLAYASGVARASLTRRVLLRASLTRRVLPAPRLRVGCCPASLTRRVLSRSSLTRRVLSRSSLTRRVTIKAPAERWVHAVSIHIFSTPSSRFLNTWRLFLGGWGRAQVAEHCLHRHKAGGGAAPILPRRCRFFPRIGGPRRTIHPRPPSSAH